MKIYNTLTKKNEEFIPFDERLVTLYTCGPTVYHYAHIGNLRTYIFEDVLEKVLIYNNYRVKRTMNITDVGHLTDDGDNGDDKMLLATEREKKTPLEIAKYYTDAFLKDMEKLNLKIPGIIENATENIDEYIKVISKLIEKGFAYESNGNVYFDISKTEDYYKLSGKNSDDLRVGVRDGVSEDLNKKNPFDFALWFTSSKFGNQSLQWDSPFGKGYPGWHIECTAISIKTLGEYLDIHCGGVDNIFPHHTNEIVQSEAYLGHKWCNYWMHGEHLNTAAGKMSKSSGEVLTLSLLKEKGYLPVEYKFFCLLSHYRSQLKFSFKSLDGAKIAYNKLINKIKILKDDSPVDFKTFEIYKDKFLSHLNNDLNTANSISVIYELLKEETTDSTKLALINSYDEVLGLDLIIKDDFSKDEIEYIEGKIEERKQAKNNKDYTLADSIRKELSEKGFTIKDTKDNCTYERRLD